MTEELQVVLSDSELMELIDQESRKRLGMSGQEFVRQWHAGLLRDSAAAREIGMLTRLGTNTEPREVSE